MKDKILNFVKEHPHTRVIDIQLALNFNGIEVLKCLNALVKEGYIKLDPPIPLSCDNENSVYYSATGKPFMA